MAWTTPKTWSTSEVVTAAMLNTHIRDNQNAATTWQSWSPAWTTGSTEPTVGNGSLTGRYCLAGDLCHFSLELSWGTTTAWGSGGTHKWSIPVTADASLIGSPIAVAWIVDGGVYYHCSSYLNGTAAQISLMTHVDGQNHYSVVNPTVPSATMGSGDSIFINGTYEAA